MVSDILTNPNFRHKKMEFYSKFYIHIGFGILESNQTGSESDLV